MARIWPFYQILEVSIEHCNGCGWPTEDVYSSGHLVLSHLGLAFVLMLRPIFPELVMSTDLLSSNIPRYFYFASSTIISPSVRSFSILIFLPYSLTLDRYQNWHCVSSSLITRRVFSYAASDMASTAFHTLYGDAANLFSTPAYLCTVTYVTETSLHVTLSN